MQPNATATVARDGRGGAGIRAELEPALKFDEPFAGIPDGRGVDRVVAKGGGVVPTRLGGAVRAHCEEDVRA